MFKELLHWNLVPSTGQAYKLMYLFIWSCLSNTHESTLALPRQKTHKALRLRQVPGCFFRSRLCKLAVSYVNKKNNITIVITLYRACLHC
jgi:hypothetical protein